MEFSPPLDKGIDKEVIILRQNGIETYESCQGGKGHSSPGPIVNFHGESAEGFRAYTIAVENGLRVSELRRTYHVEDGELVGPTWEMTFTHCLFSRVV